MTNERIEAVARAVLGSLNWIGPFAETSADSREAVLYIARNALAAADRVALAQAGELAQRLHAFGERGEGDFFQQCAAALTAQSTRIAELTQLLENLCDVIADVEDRGDGAHEDGCPICDAHAAARAALTKST